MSVLISIKISNQSRDENSAEQRKRDTKHLCSRKTEHGAKSKISKNGGRQKGRNVGIEYRCKRTPVSIINSQLVTFATRQFLFNSFKYNYVRIHGHANRQDQSGNTRR